ncbi:MAG: LysR family transcriptional regulator [Oscillospiraceae bacterium]|nr:LysR family transcriptional regulator [Oscillospiraceae bacterium]
MNSQHIEEFIVLAELGNFSLAAETLGITQPSLSRHIQALESEIKQRLVCRSPHSFQLTDAGKSFLKYGTSWLQARHVLNIALDNLQAPAENILRIGLLSGIEQTELMEKMIDFQQAHPSLCLDLRTKPASVLIPGLYAGSYDTVLLWHLNDRLKNFCTLPYRTDRMILLIPEGHPLYGRESVMLSELKQETLYMRYRRSSHFFMRFIEHCQKNGFEPRLLAMNGIFLSATVSGLCLCMHSQLHTIRRDCPCSIAEITPPFQLTISINWNSVSPVHPAVQQLVEHLVR